MRIMFICRAALLSESHSQAQRKFHLGVKAGLNFSSFKMGYFPSYLSSVRDDGGFFAGLFGEFRISEGFSIQPEGYYIESRSQPAGVLNEEVRHLNIPVLMKWNIGGLSLFAGPQASYLLKARHGIYANVGDFNTTYFDVTDSSYKKIMLSGVAGLEYTFRFGLGFDVRYQLGLNNIAKPGGITVLTMERDNSVKINTIQAGLHFRFGKRSKKSKSK